MRKAAGAFLILGVLAALALLPVLGGDRVLFPRDARSVIPWKYNADEALQKALLQEPTNDVLTDKNVFDFPKLHLAATLWKEEGKIPLWNPYTFCGNPLLASAMPSPLYPGNLFFLLDPYRGFTYSALVHLLLSGFFLFLYLRLLGFRSTAGLLAGTAYAFSGWYLVHLYLPSYIHAATWFPLMLYAVEKLARGKGAVWIGVLAAAAGLSALAGFPPVTVLSLYAAGLYLIFRLPGILRSGGLGAVLARPLKVALAVALGLCLAAFQILPTYELSRASGRSSMELSNLQEGALRPLGLVALVLPDFFGNPMDQGPDPDATGRRAGPLLPRTLGLDGPPPPQDWGNNYLENTLYIGVLPLLLALLALVRRRRAVTYFWLLMAAFALCMSLALPPLVPLFDTVPGLRIGGVKRFLFLFTAAGAILAGIGFDGAIGGGKPKRGWGFLPYVPALGLAVTAGPLLFWPGLLENLLTRLAALGPDPAAALPAADMALWVENTQGCIWRLAAVLLPASAIYFMLKRGMAARPLRFAVLLLTFLDLAWLGLAFNPVHRPDQMDTTPGLEFLGKNTSMPPCRVARYGVGAHFVLPPNAGMVHGIQDIQGWDVLFPSRYQKFMNLVEKDVAQAHHLVGPLRRAESLHSPLLDLLGVRYVLTDRDWGPEPAPGFRPAYPLGKDNAFDRERIAREGLVAYENTQCLPRAFGVKNVQVATSESEVFQNLARPGFDARTTVILEEAVSDLSPADVPVEIIAYTSRHVTLRVGPGGRAPLVLTDAFHPGWKAWMSDGTPLSILRADGVFRAVILPARTTHQEVHFHYPGSAFTHGAYAAAAAAALLALWILVAAIGSLITRRPREA